MVNRPRKYGLSPLAVADLEGIWRYMVENWSVRQAESYHAEIVEAFEGLASG
jgi:toxin ParE1/3/4